MKKTLATIYKIFFIGLLLQFVAFNVVSFKLGLDSGPVKYLWLWKEGVVGFLLLIVLLQLFLNQERKKTFRPERWGRLQLLLIAAIGGSMAIDLLVHGHGIGGYLVAFKYDFFGFVLFFVGLHSSRQLDQQQQRDLVDWYARVIKWLLLLALVRYAIILIKPGAMSILGYDNYVFEGTAGEQPPAAYYTQINQGITRNQFLFERPVSWGFFLTAFWPLFFFVFLYRKPFRITRGWWLIYGLNVFLTFSRAARGSWLILSIVIGGILLRKRKKKLLLYTIIPVIVGIGIFFTLGGKSLLTRGFSDTGHLAMLQKGRTMMIERPIWGRGGGSVGPGSHHGGMAFNPENQFLQVRIEFGTGLFLLRTALYIGLARKAVQPARGRRIVHGETTSIYHEELLLAYGLGMIGLAISGMVLHSFSDRMIVYPFMLLGGLIATHYQQKQKVLKKS